MRSDTQATQPLGTSGFDQHESKETQPVEFHTNNLDQPELDGTWMRFLSDSVGSPSLGVASSFLSAAGLIGHKTPVKLETAGVESSLALQSTAATAFSGFDEVRLPRPLSSLSASLSLATLLTRASSIAHTTSTL